MKKKSLIILVIFSVIHCSAQDRTIIELTDTELHLMEEYLNLDSLHIVKITNDQETGTPLIICGRLVKKENGNPIPDQNIYLYHTDNTGEYHRQIEDDITSARLNGIVLTDKEGLFTVKTILPGDYVTHPDTRHIHTIVKGANPEQQEFYFKQYAKDYLVSLTEERDDCFLIDLKKIDNGILIGFVTLKVIGLE
ncbi:MAG: hypothetical protein FVQ77_06945 [Cytophagales bacterium]|nr:hypothetical protein [Cytophagales bacterium]